MDVRFCAWDVRSLYRAGSPMTVVKELSNCKLDLVGVPNQPASIHVSMERGMRIMN
jgi:hypothetical protein